MSAPDLSALSGEDQLIAQYFRPLATHPGALGLRDDAAFYTPPAGQDLVLTKDAIVAGIHFFEDDPPDTIARKALRVNLSDLAAKGADPVGFLLALGLPEGLSADWLPEFSRGLSEDAAHFGCALFGGDTVRSPGPVMISITAFGTLPRGAMVHRAGAQVGDSIMVSGTIGDAAMALLLRREPSLAKFVLAEDQSFLLDRYLIPQPRTALAATVRTYANCAMDISDGLAGDLGKLCRASGVSAEVSVSATPFTRPVRELIHAAKSMSARPPMLETALTGGDDYEVLCSVTPTNAMAFVQSAVAAGVRVREIGKIVAGNDEPRFIAEAGLVLQFPHGSFSHF